MCYYISKVATPSTFSDIRLAVIRNSYPFGMGFVNHIKKYTMKTLSLTLGLLLSCSLAWAQQYPLKTALWAKQVSYPETKPAKKVNPAYSKIHRMPSPLLIDRENVQTRSEAFSTPAVVINEIKAFPNPFSTQVDVFITDGHMDKSSYKAELYDVEGRKVHSEQLFLNQTSLQLSHLSKGVYILYIEKNGKNIKQQKLVKE